METTEQCLSLSNTAGMQFNSVRESSFSLSLSLSFHRCAKQTTYVRREKGREVSEREEEVYFYKQKGLFVL